MDHHVMHNIIHQDYGNNSERCPVCNGTIKMGDDKAMQLNQIQSFVKNKTACCLMPILTINIPVEMTSDKAALHTFAEVLEFADGDLPKKDSGFKSWCL
jgi:hypothetical protein